MKLWTVKVENEIVVAADTAKEAGLIAKKVPLGEWGDFDYEAEAMTSLPFGWDTTCNPYTKDRNTDRTIAQYINDGEAPEFVGLLKMLTERKS